MNIIREAVTILDNEYGEDRHSDSGYGCYVLVIESMEELPNLEELNLDIKTTIPEYSPVSKGFFRLYTFVSMGASRTI